MIFLNRTYAFLALFVIISAASVPGQTFQSLPAPSASNPASKSSMTQVARTPLAEPDIIRSAFYVNRSTISSNFTTVEEGAPTTLDFFASSDVTISNAVVNMTIPSPMLVYTGSTLFRGEIAVGAPAHLSVTIVATMPTEITIGVVATGNTTTTQSSPQRVRAPFYFLVNTTDWYDVTHAAPLPGDPYGSNATRIPATNTTVPYMYSNAPSQMAASSVQAGPAPEFTPFTVTGTLIFFDFEFGGFLPAHHAKVGVYSDDFCLCDHLRGTGFTDDFGFFSIGGISTTSYHVSIFPEDDLGKVGPSCPASNCDWAWFEVIFFQSNSPPGGPTLNLGVKAPQGFNEAFMLHNAQLDFQRKMSNFGFTQTWKQPTVFESGGKYTPVTNIFTPPDGVNFFPSENFFAWGHTTLYHEYGHSFMERSYQVINWPCGLGCTTVSPHNMRTTSGPGFAISEGWAEFLQAFIQGSATCGSCNNFPANGFGNVETNTWLANSVPLTSNGNILEGSVASLFWDLQDNTISECYSTGGCDTVQALITTFIGANAGDNNAEFHANHRNSMVDTFGDIQNAIGFYQTTLGIKALCAVYVGNGFMPSQCIGVALSTLNSTSLLLLGSIASMMMLIHQRKRRISIA